jgi:hypothetical protein
MFPKTNDSRPITPLKYEMAIVARTGIVSMKNCQVLHSEVYWIPVL